MSRFRPTSRSLAAPMACLLAIGLWQIGDGAWIYAKAELAQLLLQRAWSRTLAGEDAAKPWPWADTRPVARLMVPRLGIDQILLEGAYGRTLAFGPGYLESSARPGEQGVTVLTGHRDTHFSFLKRLEQNDEIVIEMATGDERHYLVQETRILDSRTASIELDEHQNRIVLVTCYPFNAIDPGGPLRYVVIAERE